MEGMVKTEKTYPQWVQEAREQYLALIEQIAEKYQPPKGDAATATIMAAYDTSPEACRERYRAYREEIAPIHAQLAKLEGYVTYTHFIPADHPLAETAPR